MTSFTIPTLETDRLILRGPEARDLDGFVDYLTSDRSIYTGGPKTPGDAWRAFAVEIGHWHIRGYGSWSVTEKGSDEAVGIVGHWHPGDWPEREIGWILWPQAEGKGIAFEAAQAVLKHTFDTLEWATAVSYIDRENARSVALAKRLGAQLDPMADTPDDSTCFVYRHPKPEVTR